MISADGILGPYALSETDALIANDRALDQSCRPPPARATVAALEPETAWNGVATFGVSHATSTLARNFACLTIPTTPLAIESSGTAKA